MKKLKKLFYSLTIVLSLVLIIPPVQISATDWTTYGVYITKTGSKYHYGSCSYLRQSKILINILDAIDSGYTPCSRCNPPYSSVTRSNSASSNSTASSSSYTVPKQTVQSSVYMGYYSGYTIEFNRRLENNLFDNALYTAVQTRYNSGDNGITESEYALYQTLSVYDQQDFINYTFLRRYDAYANQLKSIEPIFNYAFYSLANLDLLDSIGTDPISLMNHFLAQGKAEGRISSPTFDINVYIQNNPDLVQVFGNNISAYYDHYLQAGQFEGRVAVIK